MADGPDPDCRTPDATIERFETSAMEQEAIPHVRHLVIEQLGVWGYNGDTRDATLVFSELVTNAVMHAGGAVRIAVTLDDHRLRIDVHDDGPGQPHVRVHRSDVGGLGLHIVDGLSTRWGSDPTPTGKTVWAMLPHHPGATQK